MAARQKENEFKLPLGLAHDNVKLVNYGRGSDFAGLEEKIRSLIATILSRSSSQGWWEALEEISGYCGQMVGKQVSFVSRDWREKHNIAFTYYNSYITFIVKENLLIRLYTNY